MQCSSFYGKKKPPLKFIRPIPDDSDDSELSGDDDAPGDDEYIQPTAAVDMASEDDTDPPSSDEEEHGSTSSAAAKPAKMPPAQRKKKVDAPRWRTSTLDTNACTIPFTGNTTLPDDIVNLKTPLQYFKQLFKTELVDLIVDESNLYAVQKQPNKPLQLTASELEQFIGTVIWMSLIKLSNARKYWSTRYNIAAVSEIMSRKRWEDIKSCMHFHDNTTDDAQDADKLRKITPVLTHLRDALRTIPKEESLCVDEQIVPFKGRSGLKMYNPNKPHKWGYKIWVLSGASGFSYDFEVYTGGGVQVNATEVDCGASSNVVVRLCRTVTSDVGHKMYFDNYFTSLKLLEQLELRKIQSVGTVRLNRLPGLKGPSEKEMKKAGRGTISEQLTTIGGTDISCIRWYDNKLVSLLSTFVGSQPVKKVRRWSKAEKQYKEIDCPKVIEVYNRHMGGVDLLDSLMGLYRIHVRSHKWYHRLFFHAVDMAIVNAWLLYRRSFDQQQMPGARLTLSEFKEEVAEGKSFHVSYQLKNILASFNFFRKQKLFYKHAV